MREMSSVALTGYPARHYRLSRIDTERFMKWLAQRPDVQDVRDIQDEPALYYHGDVAALIRDQWKLLEIKCEQYYALDPTHPRFTTNIAVERYSNKLTHTPGGVFSTRSDYYIHLFKDGLICVMETQAMRHFVIRHIGDFRIFEAQNPSWCSLGYLIPRKRLRRYKWYTEYTMENTHGNERAV